MIRMLEWAVPEDADITDMALVKRANPASWITRDALARQRAAVAPVAFARFHANQWVGDERSWLPPGAWGECVGEPAFEEGERVWVGVDVGGERRPRRRLGQRGPCMWAAPSSTVTRVYSSAWP